MFNKVQEGPKKFKGFKKVHERSSRFMKFPEGSTLSMKVPESSTCYMNGIKRFKKVQKLEAGSIRFNQV